MKELINKIAEKKTGFVSAVTAFLALILTFTWFMPVVSIAGRSFTMLEAMKHDRSDREAIAAFTFYVVIFAAAVVWAALPKLWAAIVGTLYSIFPMVLCVVQVNDWSDNRYIDLLLGGHLMRALSILVFLLSIAKLAVVIMEKKRNKNPAAENRVTEIRTAEI